MNEDIFKYKHSKSIAEAENNDLSENIISCHSGVQTVGIRFNPNAEYASGMYLAGTDIPFGLVKILLIGKPSEYISGLIQQKTDSILFHQQIVLNILLRNCCFQEFIV